MDTILEKLVREKFKIDVKNVYDVDISFWPFLSIKECEPVALGEPLRKSYYYKSTEVIRIELSRVLGNVSFDNSDYENVLIGSCTTVNFLNYGQEIGITKSKNTTFNVQPVFNGDGSETCTGFSSPAQREFLRNERRERDLYFQSKSPIVYSSLYRFYATLYDFYLKTGDRFQIENAINNETNAEILAILNNQVYGSETTVRELIINNLQ